MSFRTLIGAPLLALLAAGGLRADGPMLQKAPPNPDFVKWQEGLRERRREARAAGAAQAAGEGARKTGFVPPPIRYPDAAGPATEAEAMARAGVRAYPASYDLRERGVLSPVRNQGVFGTCWAFAVYASLESNIRKTAGAGADFSEWHTAWFAYNPVNGMPSFTKGTADYGDDPVFDQGGNADMVLALASRGTGPVSEAAVPYQNTKNYPQSSLPNGREPNAATVGSVYSFHRCDRDTIKGLVQTYGALSTAMLWPEENEDRYYSPSGRAFRYVQGGSFASNHLVNVVGWDDAFSRSKFPTSNQPAADGAWIVRNSWGPSWGDGGYFYMSYDTTIEYFYSFTGSLQLDAKTYQYDYLGLIGSLGYGGDTAWFSNIFTAAGDDTVTDVAFYTQAANASYEISVRTGVGASPASGAPAIQSQYGVLELPGYHRIRLKAPVGVVGGQKFAVIVKLTAPSSSSFPIPIHYPYEGYSDGARAQSGVGFASSNGTAWSDIKSIPNLGMDNVSICLKAFAVPVPATIEMVDPPPVVFLNETVAFEARVGGLDNKTVKWTVDGGGTIDASGKFKAPDSAQAVTVTATSAADPALGASAGVSVMAAPDGGDSKNPQLLGFGNAYGGSARLYDLNGDGRVDEDDLTILFRGMGW